MDPDLSSEVGQFCRSTHVPRVKGREMGVKTGTYVLIKTDDLLGILNLKTFFPSLMQP